jgi:peroxiredoxin
MDNSRSNNSSSDRRQIVRGIFYAMALVMGSISNEDYATAQDSGVTWTSFSGSLLQPGAGDGDILRRFEVDLVSNGPVHFFHVSDDLRSGCPWPERFGRTGKSSDSQGVQPHLVYPYDTSMYVIALPPMVVELPENAQPDATFAQGEWQMTILERNTVNGVPAWMVEARERRGRKQILAVSEVDGGVLRAEAEVFMGQGDKFMLTLARTERKQLPPEMTQPIEELETQLISLQVALKRRPDALNSELSQRQVDDAINGIEQMTRLAADTPLESLVKLIRTDTEQQKKRLASSSSRAKELMGSAAPSFSLSLVSGGALDSSSLNGKTVVLHFWDYRDAPLSEPYGQTGYLEFLFNQKRKMNVEVVGISTNPDLQNSENAGRGRRSARKLSEFMRLTYPIGHDDGKLLEAFGDPRDAKGQLPLWIVLTADGKVAHYHAGFYEVDANQGLKELEAVLSEQIKKQQ